MASDTQSKGIETRLNQKSVWQDVLLISTSVFMYGLSHAVPVPIERETPSRSRRLYDQEACSFSSSTVLDFSPLSSLGISTATSIYEEEDSSDNYIVKAPVVKEFKLLIRSLKIDRSLPRLFAE